MRNKCLIAVAVTRLARAARDAAGDVQPLLVATFLLVAPLQAVGEDSATSQFGPLPPDVELTGEANADALYVEAYKHENGIAQPSNAKQAIELYCAAAEQGHPAAAYRVGWFLLHGIEVDANVDAAAGWLKRAEALGSRPAHGLLDLIPNAQPVREPACPRQHTVGNVNGTLAPLDAPREIRNIVGPIARRHQLDPDLVLSVIAVESAFDGQAVSPKGALGLMQLMPDTAARFGVESPFEPQQNVSAGVRYLAWLKERFDGDLDKVLAAYNAGEGVVARYGGIPPYPETRRYVEKVRRTYQSLTQAKRTEQPVREARTGG